MKAFSSLTSCLALPALLLTAQAQPPASSAKPTKPAGKQTISYQGPKVVRDSKALGRIMVQKSEPADNIRLSLRELPAKK